MTNGTPGWHPVTDRNVNKFLRIQNRASRFIHGKNCSHELDNSILPVKSLLQYIDLIFFYQRRNNLIDCAVFDSIRTGRAVRGEDGVNHLIPPQARTKMLQSGFVYRSVYQWNNLPAQIKFADYLILKANLKYIVCLLSYIL
jgi:hypothetical protein